MEEFPDLLPKSEFNLQTCLWAASIIETHSVKIDGSYGVLPDFVGAEESLILLF
jgi:hypothetical protein